eukprot:CAMPEP_0118940414 /NCGR_PEP_ID=MMETSP1169-20130426/31367_1 /TAXON_ID=36882 /ORGANISM="Pyramimonas obovata, Strain CCMP722" /LENGTH=59 /DNA_ID=CAMNT_0006884887 /DNA_START=90 /DNA_END=269 /DNA_ORIENTATION=+
MIGFSVPSFRQPSSCGAHTSRREALRDHAGSASLPITYRQRSYATGCLTMINVWLIEPE